MITVSCLHNYFPIMELSFTQACLCLHSPHSIAMIGQGSIGLLVMGLYTHTHTHTHTHSHMGVQRCWNAWNSRLVIQTRSYDCIIINSFSVFLHFSFLPLHTHTHTHTTHTQHTHITVPHSNSHFFRWKIENRPTDEHHLQSVCIFCPNLQQRATKKSTSGKNVLSLFIMHSIQYLNTLFTTSCFIHRRRRWGVINDVGGTEWGLYGAGEEWRNGGAGTVNSI